jgi:hypothetical protein
MRLMGRWQLTASADSVGLSASAGILVGVSGGVVGRAVNAVLVPPQAERFASLVGVDLDQLVLNVSGWNKLVLLDSDRVFLFPRSPTAARPAGIPRRAPARIRLSAPVRRTGCASS